MEIRKMISAEEIRERTAELAQKIAEDYAGREIHMICVLKGGAFFMANLAGQMPESVPVSLDFMSVASYGDDTKSSGIVRIIKDLDEPIEGKDVLLVEDIIDSGRTLFYLKDMLSDRKPASFKICTLLDKPDRRVKDIEPDYTAFVIEDKFVVGCGMDYKQHYRNLPYIGEVIL